MHVRQFFPARAEDESQTRACGLPLSLSNNAKTHTACMYTICVYTRWLGGRWVRVQCYAEGERVSAALSREICDEASLMRASDQVFSSIYIMMGGNEVAYVHMYVLGLGRLRFMLYIYIFTLKLFSKALNENLTYLNAYTFEQKNNPSSLFRMVVEFYFFSHLLKSHWNSFKSSSMPRRRPYDFYSLFRRRFIWFFLYAILYANNHSKILFVFIFAYRYYLVVCKGTNNNVASLIDRLKVLHPQE